MIISTFRVCRIWFLIVTACADNLLTFLLKFLFCVPSLIFALIALCFHWLLWYRLAEYTHFTPAIGKRATNVLSDIYICALWCSPIAFDLSLNYFIWKRNNFYFVSVDHEHINLFYWLKSAFFFQLNFLQIKSNGINQFQISIGSSTRNWV